MAKRSKKEPTKRNVGSDKVKGLHAQVMEQPITQTLEINYMPYAMSVIISRAIPEIDGLKPSHRKLLYTMYQMKLLTGNRTKSANVVGATMKLNPHGDAAIYDTMVRLSRGYGALLHPLVDSKGNFGKVYSRDMAWAASRYTEVKLDSICQELFRDIDKDTVDFVDNYDGSMKEPTLLPTTFPNVLVSANQGIAVGMASNVCGFNLGEVCDATIARMRHPGADLLDTLKAPDFPTGAQLLYDRAARCVVSWMLGILKHCGADRALPSFVCVEGSTFMKAQLLQSRVYEYVRQYIIQSHGIDLRIVKAVDTTLTGAAAAAVSTRQR
jgi:DNA gyrase subunit A